MARVFVQQNVDGTFSTVVEDAGGFSEVWRGSQSEAENQANRSNQQFGNVSTSPSDGGDDVTRMRNELYQAGGDPRWLTAPSDQVTAEYNRLRAAAGGQQGNFNWQNLWGALTGSNREQFDWQKEQFGRSFEEQKRQADRMAYSNLAQALLSGATSLQRPENWLRYANYTTGGKNIFSRLFGGEPAPTFGQPTGYSAPATIVDLLRELGLLQGGEASAQPASAQSSGMSQALQQATAPVTGSMSGGSLPQGVQQVGDIGNAPTYSTDSDNVSAYAAANNLAPLPYQINPATWDSLSPTAKTMVLASVQAGNTPSGYWEPTDYLTQFEASRPKGVAPTRISTQFAGPQSYF